MTEHPAALQLRLLQTVVEVAAEKNSTLVLPFPVELLRFLERSTPPEPVKATGADKRRHHSTGREERLAGRPTSHRSARSSSPSAPVGRSHSTR